MHPSVLFVIIFIALMIKACSFEPEIKSVSLRLLVGQLSFKLMNLLYAFVSISYGIIPPGHK